MRMKKRHTTNDRPSEKIVYWHRELPPLDSEGAYEDVIEATSNRVSGTLDHRDELWNECYRHLMANATKRIEAEVVRLKGNCAHVLDESVDTRRDEATGEAWLHGRFIFVVSGKAAGYSHPAQRITGRTSA